MPEVGCFFEIQRRPIEDRRLETMASGRLRINNGVFDFRRHSWRTRGMADPSYLQDEGNLRLLKDGRPIGKMPYFHLFINQGEVAKPPRYVELTKEREQGDKGSPEGVFSFYVDDWQECLLSNNNNAPTCNRMRYSKFSQLAWRCRHKFQDCAIKLMHETGFCSGSNDN